MFVRVLTVFSACVMCVGFVAGQGRTAADLDRPTTLARANELSPIYGARLSAINKYKVTVDPTRNAVTGKPIPVANKIPSAVPMAESLREEVSNSFIVGGGYNFQRVDDLPVERVQGVFVTGFYYPVSWIGFGGEYQYGTGSQTEIAGNTSTEYKLTRHVGVLGPEFSGYPSDNTRLFFHPLAGWAKERLTTRTGNASKTHENTNLAIQLGGGLDYRLTRTFAWRVFQVDYLGIKRSGFWQNNWRVATGVSVRGH